MTVAASAGCASAHPRTSGAVSRRGGSWTAILAVVLVTACGGDDGAGVDPVPPPPPAGTVVGRVTVEGTGLPGILVSLSGAATQSTATGTDGSYRLVAVPVGSYVVTLSSGIPADVVFARTTTQVTLSFAGQESQADFVAEYLRTSTIAGTVVIVAPEDPRRPLEGVTVNLSGVEDKTRTTDASGRYEFVALRAGEYTVTVGAAEGYTFGEPAFAASLSTGQRLEHDFLGAGALFVMTDSLGLARVTVPYASRLEAFGGSGGYAWRLAPGSRLPSGLELLADGTIQGTPLEAALADIAVVVTDNAASEAAGTVSLRVCEGPLGLGVGDYRVFDREALLPCGFYVRAPEPGAYYRVTLVETHAQSGRAYDVALTTDGGEPDQAAARAAARAADRDAPSLAGRAASALGTRRRRSAAGARAALQEARLATAAMHARLRRRETELFERLAAEGRLDVLPDRSREVASVRRDRSGAGSAPEERDFRVVNLDNVGCDTYRTVTARLTAENDYFAVYEYATEIPAEHLQSTIDFYAEHGAEVLERYFGGVSDVNGDGTATLMIRPGREMSGLLGYVWAADFVVSREVCAGSNEREMVTLSDVTFSQLDRNDHHAPFTLVHEMKHISSTYKRLRHPSELMHPGWIEEGTAVLAEELTSRNVWHEAGGPAPGERVTRTEILGAFEGAARREVWGVWLAVGYALDDFSVAPANLNRSSGGEASGYGSGWHFHRFLLDQLTLAGRSPADGQDFIRELNDSLTAPGMGGVVEMTGRSMEELLTDHAVAMTVAGSEDLVEGDAPRFLTYDLPGATDIFTFPNPPGLYPWPVTTTGEDGGSDPAAMAVPLRIRGTRTFEGSLASSGLRFHDYRARAAGDASAFYVDIPESARVVVARIRDPLGGS